MQKRKKKHIQVEGKKGSNFGLGRKIRLQIEFAVNQLLQLVNGKEANMKERERVREKKRER